MSKRGKLIVLSGPGGVGKSTIVSKLIDNPNFFFSVSATTRKPRPGEVDGRSYHFIDDKSFDELISKNLLLEWAEFAGARYGSIKAPIDQALSEGKNVLNFISISTPRKIERLISYFVFIVLIVIEDYLVFLTFGNFTPPTSLTTSVILFRPIPVFTEFTETLCEITHGELI